MPGSSTTPGHPGTRAHAPVCIAFHLRKSVGTREMNLYGAQWLAYVLPYRRFVVVLTGDYARLGANVDRYSFIASDLHRLLVAGLPAHCEKFWTLPIDVFADKYGAKYDKAVACLTKDREAPLGREADADLLPRGLLAFSYKIFASTTKTKANANAVIMKCMIRPHCPGESSLTPLRLFVGIVAVTE
jgi:hypothetical protein